jgi:isocitrate dehydrogenase
LLAKQKNKAAAVLGTSLGNAVGTFLEANKNPSRKVKEIDNRGSHYWLARYWSEELAKQTEDTRLKSTFEQLAKDLSASEQKVLKELIDCQGSSVDLGGYYHVDQSKADKAMNPSETLNAIFKRLEQGADAKI